MTTILLTGLPRSGTTLLCKLLNDLDDSVALAEPMSPSARSPDQLLADVDRFVTETRRSALASGIVPTRGGAGGLRDNFVDPPVPGQGLRPVVSTLTMLRIEKPLNSGFRLYIKHPGAFTAGLPLLQTHYPMFALVRNPIAVLASWQTVDMPVQRGRVPAAERVDPSLAKRLAAIEDRLARQVELMRWFLERFATLPPEQIIRYEDLIEQPEGTLGRLHPAPGRVTHTLRRETATQRYPDVDVAALEQAVAPLRELIAPLYPDWSGKG